MRPRASRSAGSEWTILVNALGSGGPAPSLDADTAFACFIQCNLSHGVVPKKSYFEAFHACYKNDSRAQVED